MTSKILLGLPLLAALCIAPFAVAALSETSTPDDAPGVVCVCDSCDATECSCDSGCGCDSDGACFCALSSGESGCCESAAGCCATEG